MADFPTLTGKGAVPVVNNYLDEFATDPTIRTPKDAGYVQTRAKFTSIQRKYRIVYRGINLSDKNLIYNFEKDTVVGGSEAFNFNLPTGGGTLSVRFAGKVSFRPWEDTNFLFWIVEFIIETVDGI